MKIVETVELVVCGCCVQAIANAEGCECPPEEHPRPLMGHLVVEGSDADLGFSKSPCDACGTKLAGDRFTAAELILA